MIVPPYPFRAFDRCLRATVCALPLLHSSALPGFGRETPQLDAEAASVEYPASAAKRLRPATPPFPAAVQAAVEDGRHECLAEGGTKFVAGPGLVRMGDLTGAERTDYAMDFREAHCTDRMTVFSGTGGWDLALFVSRKAGEPVRVFSGRVLDYDLGRPGAAHLALYAAWEFLRSCRRRWLRQAAAPRRAPVYFSQPTGWEKRDAHHQNDGARGLRRGVGPRHSRSR